MVGLDVVAGEATDVIGSVADRAVVERVFADHGIEAVIHAGALHKPDIARFPEKSFVDVNVTGTLNLLQAAVAAGHDRFVLTSTTSLMISRRDRGGEGIRRRLARRSNRSAGAAQHLRPDQADRRGALPPL